MKEPTSSRYFQGIYINKKHKHYIKISLTEKKRDVLTRKVWSNTTNNIIDFSKEGFFPLGEKDPDNLEIVLQLKRYRGFGAKSKRSLPQWPLYPPLTALTL